MSKLTPKMYTLFDKIAMLACDEWQPIGREDDEWWQGASYEDKEYDIHLYVDEDDCVRADVYPVIDGQTHMTEKPMRLW